MFMICSSTLATVFEDLSANGDNGNSGQAGDSQAASSSGTHAVVIEAPVSADGDKQEADNLQSPMMRELALMQVLPEFAEFQTLIQNSLAGRGKHSRMALSQHTTTSCQPRKDDKDLKKVSLKSAGLEVGVPADGGIKVVLNLCRQWRNDQPLRRKKSTL